MRRAAITLLLLSIALTVGVGKASAQRGLKGQLAAGIGAGTVDGLLLRDENGSYRYYAALELTRCNRNHSYWSVTAAYQRKDYLYSSITARQTVPVRQYSLSAGYNMPLISDRGRNVTLYGSLAAAIGYEVSGAGGKTMYDGAHLTDRDAFLYGPALGLSIETYLSDRVVLSLGVKERCLFGSPTGVFHTQVGLGLRIIIN